MFKFGDVLKYALSAPDSGALRVMVIGESTSDWPTSTSTKHVIVIAPWAPPTVWKDAWGKPGYIGDLNTTGMVKEDE